MGNTDGFLTLPCGAKFHSDLIAYEHYIRHEECQAIHKSRGFSEPPRRRASDGENTS